MVMNNTKNPALITSGMETINVPTRLRILGKAFIDLRGLNTRRILRAFSLTLTERRSTNLDKIH